MKLFPDIEKAIPLPHEKVLRFAVRKIRNNYSEQWLEKPCIREGVAEIYTQYSKQGIFDILEGNAIRSFYPPRLTIELVPRSCWFDNVRNAVTVNQWDSLRKKTAKQAKWSCQVCGGKGVKWPVECHEIWQYDDENQIQTLIGLTSLCPSCHEVKHIGFTELRGKLEEATAHLAIVNGWSLEASSLYIEESFETWDARSRVKWKLDLSWLENEGVFVSNNVDEDEDASIQDIRRKHEVCDQIKESNNQYNVVNENNNSHGKVSFLNKILLFFRWIWNKNDISVYIISHAKFIAYQYWYAINFWYNPLKIWI
nr:hypothetical protein [Providencia rettgeri]